MKGPEDVKQLLKYSITKQIEIHNVLSKRKENCLFNVLNGFWEDLNNNNPLSYLWNL